jgi:signal transduction histidine kinase
MNIPKSFYKLAPSALVIIFLLLACTVFTFKYVCTFRSFSLLFTEEYTNQLLFYLNFYVFILIGGVSICWFLFSNEFLSRGICVVIGLSASLLCVYFLEDILTINNYICIAYIIAVSVSFSLPKSGIFTACSVIIFVLAQTHPSFLGKNPMGFDFARPDPSEVAALTINMVLPSVIIILLRFFVDKYIQEKDVISHLNLVGTQLVLFNHQLQELAKTRGEEAVKQDRLRFTRDLHDGCGYAFTNIIAVTDAAISCGEMDTANSQEILQRIRNLATEGFRETREILHLIRSIQEPYTKSIDTVIELKKIFEKVTDIQVAVDWGNMRHDYGPVISRILTRIMQEAFTNSIRHGQATRIQIQFWEFPGELTMTVTDNGVGGSVVVKGIGLAGMEERLEAIGGRLAVSFPPEGGFRLTITIPLTNIK